MQFRLEARRHLQQLTAPTHTHHSETTSAANAGAPGRQAPKRKKQTKKQAGRQRAYERPVLRNALSQGKARTQSPTTTNYAVEFPTFGEIAGVSTSGVQWISLALGKPPS